MPPRLHAWPDQQWPEDIRFLPFIGRRYEDGFAGDVRVLLLGESHYRADGIDNSPAITRPFTRKEFGDLIEPIRRGGVGRFFPPMDRMLTGTRKPSPEHAAGAWDHVAFMNLVQEFAGNKPGDRPTSAQLMHGVDVLVQVALPILKPHIVLALGSRTWDGLDSGLSREVPAPFVAERVRAGFNRDRTIWSLPYAGGEALTTWVYHPSRSIDHWEDTAGALRHLVGLHQKCVIGVDA